MVDRWSWWWVGFFEIGSFYIVQVELIPLLSYSGTAPTDMMPALVHPVLVLLTEKLGHHG